MKRIWFSIIFLILALGVCIYEQATVTSGYKEIISVIDTALESENEEEKIKYCEEITKKWDKYFDKITLVTDHSIVQSADVSVGTINELAEEKDGSVDEVLIETKSELNQIYNSSKITLSNIF